MFPSGCVLQLRPNESENVLHDSRLRRPGLAERSPVINAIIGGQAPMKLQK